MNDLIKERDERTKRRKKFKKRIDSEYNLAFKDDEKIMLSGNTMNLKAKSVRLLDEGAVVGDDYVDFIIRKGTLEKYLNGENKVLPNLTDDFVGTVNLGHMDFATFPFIIGEWTKKDLTLVDIGDERVGIDVKVKLDKNSMFVQELKRQPYDIGISSEFYYSVDCQATEDIGILVIDEVYIFAYGLVGECGNVNSSGLELKGDFDMKDKVKINLEVEGLDEAMDNLDELSDEVEDAEIGDDTIEDIVAEVEAEMNDAEDESDEAESEPEAEAEAELALEDETEIESEPTEGSEGEQEDDTEEAESVEESVVEEVDVDEAPEDDEDEAEEDDELTEALSVINSLKERIDELTSIVAELKKNNRRLSRKIEAEKGAKAKLFETTKNLAIELLPGEDEAEKQKVDEEAIRQKNRDYVRNGDIADI